MLDAQLQLIIQNTLVAGLVARGLNPVDPPLNVGVLQNNQPRQFAAPSVPTVYHTLGPRKPYGWVAYKDVVNGDGTISTTETQVMRTRFQIAALVPNDSPANSTGMTSGDLSNTARAIMQNENALASFVAAGCNVFRVTDNPAVPFQDSSDQTVWWASFDIIFTHKDVFTTSTGVLSDFKPKINSVS